MTSSLPAQGFELLVYGMGTVFAFLALLVVATRLMSAVVRRFPEPELPAATAATPAAASGPSHGAGGPADPRLLAAAVAAVHLHRARTGQSLA